MCLTYIIVKYDNNCKEREREWEGRTLETSFSKTFAEKGRREIGQWLEEEVGSREGFYRMAEMSAWLLEDGKIEGNREK